MCPVSLRLSFEHAERFPYAGTVPTHQSKKYKGPIVIEEPGVHFYTFAAFGDMMADSEPTEFSVEIQIRVDVPVILPDTGIYKERVTMELLCATEGATLYYTVDGSSPNPKDNARIYTGEALTHCRSRHSIRLEGSLDAMYLMHRFLLELFSREEQICHSYF